MEKTTLYLDAADYRRLKRIAVDVRRSPAALVREAVAQYVARYEERRMPQSIGAFTSGRRNLGEQAEALLPGLGVAGRRTRRDRR
jgi:hypothetical protein